MKDRIVEFLAVRKLRADRDVADGDGRAAGTVITLVGPPGVGKTSLGESIARAMGRNFVRVALGGVRDEAEIRGHRRTYVGSQPGRIARAIIEAGSMNPVVLLDEVDKLSPGGWGGDPTAALLEVLDPAQNHTFRDHYLEVELDLSQVVFIATANVADTIPAPLLDRMELIRLDGYTEDEKVFIAQRYLLPRQLDARRPRRPTRSTSPTTRSAPRSAATPVKPACARSSASSASCPARSPRRWPPRRRDATGRRSTPRRARVARPAEGRRLDARAHQRARHRHRPRRHRQRRRRAVHRDHRVPARRQDGEPTLTLTGQLGDVMKESAHIALSATCARTPTELGVDPATLAKRVHVHVPAGAVPKDGPSAGVTMTTALVSLLTGKVVKPNVGMTGEITLQGKVLPDRRRQAEGARRAPCRVSPRWCCRSATVPTSRTCPSACARR